LLLLASLHEALRVGYAEIESPVDIDDVSELTSGVQARGEIWKNVLSDNRLRVVVNQMIVEDDAPVHHGDEVAWLPPVTGG